MTAPAHLAAREPAVAGPQSTKAVPVIPEGRRDLTPEMYAERFGDTVIVHFDTRYTRTRRPGKFERTVRLTLPLVYGVLADSMLARVPEGTLAAGGDLVSQLPSRGIRLTAPGGAGVTVWPMARPRYDGPVVVAYRVTPRG